MNNVNKYKQVLSATLLFLYVFVTTPVQWLHYHESDKIAEKQLFGGQDRLVFSDQDSNQSTENCAICLHKYSSYNNDFFHPRINSIELESPAFTAWIEANYHHHKTSFDNKGPPLVS